MDYNELYEYLRKEKYSEQLQVLPKNFISEVSELLKEGRKSVADASDFFSEDAFKNKKSFENSVSLFKELMRLRKKKILNLVFVASETGIMKRDFGIMLGFEQDLFEKLVGSVEDGDKLLQQLLNGTTDKLENKMVIITHPLSELVDMSGNVIGPFDKGTLVNLNAQIADILVSESKAQYVDEETK